MVGWEGEGVPGDMREGCEDGEEVEGEGGIPAETEADNNSWRHSTLRNVLDPVASDKWA